MSSLVILFTATIAIIVSLNKAVDSASYSAVDVNKLLELVQKQQQKTGNSKQRRLQLRKPSDSDSGSLFDDSLSDSDTSSDSDHNRYARLRKGSIIDLIENVANEKANRVQNDGRITAHRKGKSNYGHNNYRSHSEKVDNSQGNIESQILEQLLSKGINGEERKTKPRGDHPKNKPNRLLGDGPNNEITDYYKNEDNHGLDRYSKIYIVLNPQAVQKSKNKNSLNELLSKVLTLSSPTLKKERQVKRKPRYYKGLVVNDDLLSRQSEQESKELNAPWYYVGNDYNSQKRTRYGGIAAGRRTAVPT